MPDKTWKQRERQIAQFFGTVRNSLSGGNSKLTRSDSCHDTLYVEAKHAKRHKIWSLYEEALPRAKKESKIPVLAMSKSNRQGFLIVFHSQDFKVICIKYLKGLGYDVARKRNAKRVEVTRKAME